MSVLQLLQKYFLCSFWVNGDDLALQLHVMKEVILVFFLEY